MLKKHLFLYIFCLISFYYLSYYLKSMMRRGNIVGLILLSSIFSLLFNIGVYSVGYYGGKRIISKYNNKLSKGRFLFSRYGNISVFICRLIPFSKIAISLLAGVYRQKYSHFLLLSSLGIIICNSFLISLGVSVIINIDHLINFYQNFKILILIFLSVSIILIIMRKNRSKKR